MTILLNQPEPEYYRTFIQVLAILLIFVKIWTLVETQLDTKYTVYGNLAFIKYNGLTLGNLETEEEHDTLISKQLLTMIYKCIYIISTSAYLLTSISKEC